MPQSHYELAVAAEGGEIEGEDAPPEATAEGDEIEGEDAEDAEVEDALPITKKRTATLVAFRESDSSTSSEEEELEEEVWEAQEELREKEVALHERQRAQQAAGALNLLSDRTVEVELQEDTAGKRRRRQPH